MRERERERMREREVAYISAELSVPEYRIAVDKWGC